MKHFVPLAQALLLLICVFLISASCAAPSHRYCKSPCAKRNTALRSSTAAQHIISPLPHTYVKVLQTPPCAFCFFLFCVFDWID